jgi:hypothetical protein
MIGASCVLIRDICSGVVMLLVERRVTGGCAFRCSARDSVVRRSLPGGRIHGALVCAVAKFGADDCRPFLEAPRHVMASHFFGSELIPTPVPAREVIQVPKEGGLPRIMHGGGGDTTQLLSGAHAVA